MARSDRRAVHWPTPTHTKRPDEGLALFPTMKPWRPAREIIDWQLKGRSIFNRKKPLAPKTLERIYAGAVKFRWPEPYLVILRNHMAAQSLDAAADHRDRRRQRTCTDGCRPARGDPPIR
jgi:DNA (cytosine-5)-methyltransferase 1